MPPRCPHLRKQEALFPRTHEEQEAAAYYACFLLVCHRRQLMGLSEWPRQTDLIFFRIRGPGRLENARLLNCNTSLTLPTKMQINEVLSSVGSWPGSHHHYWGESLHRRAVLFSLTAPCLSLSLTLDWAESYAHAVDGGLWVRRR